MQVGGCEFRRATLHQKHSGLTGAPLQPADCSHYCRELRPRNPNDPRPRPSAVALVGGCLSRLTVLGPVDKVR